MEAPKHPAGPFSPDDALAVTRRNELIEAIAAVPGQVRALVADLSDDQLATKYRNWTLRQIVHHLADSHTNAYVRFKWTLTEENPTIKAYNESLWAELDDSQSGNLEVPLAMLDAVHARWVRLMRTMTDAAFERTYFHPESKKTFTLNGALALYEWHSRHHTAMLAWVRTNRLSIG
jgi:DinB superfamily